MEYIVNNSLDPYFNLSLEEYLFRLENNNTYFLLWQNSSSVIIGKNQNAFNEVDLDFIKTNGIKLARRITGGGAVYHDSGNLNFTFITPSNHKKEYDFIQFTDQINRALKLFSIDAEYSGRNDLLIDGKKISGSAQLVGKTKIIHHGTLLFSSDLEKIEKCLTPSKEKLNAHGVSSVKSRVTAISKHLPEKISLLEFKDKLAKEILKNYENVNIRELTEDEVFIINKLRTEKFSTNEWIYGTSSVSSTSSAAQEIASIDPAPLFNYSKSLRIENCGLINIDMIIKSGIIDSCKISGDFFGSGDISELEHLLKNKTFTCESVLFALESIDIKYYFNNLSLNNFLQLFDFEF